MTGREKPTWQQQWCRAMTRRGREQETHELRAGVLGTAAALPGSSLEGRACKPSSSELPSTAPELAQGYIHHSQAHSNTTFMFDGKIYSMWIPKQLMWYTMVNNAISSHQSFHDYVSALPPVKWFPELSPKSSTNTTLSGTCKHTVLPSTHRHLVKTHKLISQ